MQRIKIDRTDITVSRIGMGTASLHHLYRESDRSHLIEVAYEMGVTHYDTSPYYGYGIAESALGNVFKHKRDKITLTSKVGLYSPGFGSSMPSVLLRKAFGKLYPKFSLPEVNWSIKRANQSLNLSLKRLQTNYLDFLFLHEPDSALINSEEFLEWLYKVQAQGKVRNWGVAGEVDLFKEWILYDNPLVNVIQARDSIDIKEASLILKSSRCLQFTYGYLSKCTSNSLESAPVIISQALDRNPDGCVLFSTRDPNRIKELITSI